MLWRMSVEGAVHTNCIEVAPVCVERSLQVDRIPEEGMIQMLATAMIMEFAPHRWNSWDCLYGFCAR